MKFFTLYFFSFILFTSYSFGQITFQKIYSDTVNLFGHSSALTKDGGYIIAGTRFGSGGGSGIIYLIKADSIGNMQWTRTYGQSDFLFPVSVKQTYDGAYIILGNASPGIYENTYVFKTDSIGSLLWTKKYDVSGYNYLGYEIQQTLDSGYILVGNTTNAIPCCRDDIFLIKTDANGNLVWSKSYRGNDDYEWGLSIQQTSDSGYIFTGRYGDATPPRIWAVKTNKTGYVIWSRTYGRGEGYSVQQTTDGGYIISGGRVDNPIHSAVVVKTNSSGYQQWEKIFQRTGMDNDAFSVVETTNGGYIVSGTTGHLGLNDIFVFRLDLNGDTLWTKYYGGTGDNSAFSIHQTTDNGYAISGYSGSFGSGLSSFYLVKTDSSGNSGCNTKNLIFTVDSNTVIDSIPYTVMSSLLVNVSIPVTPMDSGGTESTLCFSVGINETLITNRNIDIFPNPSSGRFTISFSNFLNSSKVEIYNVFGEIIFEDDNYLTDKKEINLKDISAGIYFVKVFDSDKSYCKKLIIEEN